MRTAHISIAAGLAAAALIYLPASALAAAGDNAGNAPYANGWQAGDNGGFGFGPWTLAFSGDASALIHSGAAFIDNGPLAGDSLGQPTFALTTSARPSFFDTSEAVRTLNSTFAVGQTFSIDVDGSALDPAAPAFSIGNTVQLLNSAGEERFGLFTNNGFNGDNWTATGAANTGVAAANPFHLEFTLVTPETYNMVMRPVGGGAPLFSQTGATLGGPAGTPIDRIRISNYGTGSSANGSMELFFDNLQIIVPEPASFVLLVLGFWFIAFNARRH
jgi:hypothetical protein